ncbi:septum site-determining protein MinC [Ideonella sp. BN130291]|uniref:septum site-determining protein MinC n=1 Tax=Ideonella sp. BN130291 TaxID=3112940 RepID=UPI002E25D72F|nr:septum site-determining protein MinC [Ideonella sp. BN130291]
MAVPPTGSAPAVFDLKNTSLPLVSVALRSADLDVLREALDQRLRDTPNFFNHDPVVLDIAALRSEPAVIDFAALVQLLRQHKMQPIAVAGASAEQLEAALAAGLSEAPAAAPAPQPRVETVVREVIKEVVREVPGVAPPTLVIDKPLRSGQQVYAKGGDLIVLAAVNFGAEVIADGNVHVYAPLRGKAIAGARGNTEARIFTTCLEPELIAIAGVYRTTETAIPAEVAGKAAQIRLVGDKLVMELLES